MSDIKQILSDYNFKFNKQFGQNFITDTNLLQAMVKDSGITSEDIVVEIGAGAGYAYSRDSQGRKTYY